MQTKLRGIGWSLLLACIFCLQSAQAAVNLSGRHIYVFFPGLDAVWGSYLFLVNNPGTEAERFTFPVLLPTETIDFQGQDNLNPDELKLGPDGGLTIDKVFAPGDSMISIGFKLPADQGVAKATVKPAYDFESLGFFVWQDTMAVEGDGLSLDVRKGVSFSGKNYDTYTLMKGVKDQSYKIQIRGIPEGRGRLWIIGGILMGILLLSGLGFAFLSRPQLSEREELI